MDKNSTESAYQCLGQTLTFADIDKKSSALATYLLEVAKLNAGDRVVIQLPNITQYPIAAYAVIRAGLVLVNTNPLYTAREMQHQFSDSGAKAIIILADLLPKLVGIIEQTNINTIIATHAIDLMQPQIINEKKVLSANLISFSEALKSGNEFSKINRQPININDIAAIQYTGGTTGVSKGAVLTHKNLLSNVMQASERLSNVAVEGEECFVTPLPLYHIYALLLNLWVFSKGNNNILIPNPRDIEGFIDTLMINRVTGFCGINTLFIGLCSHPKIKEVNFDALKFTISGGAALTSTATDNWYKITGCTISEGYGLSETSPVVTLNEPGKEQLGTIGLPVIGTEVQIWNDDAKEVKLGETGELVVRGPQVMQGYWQQRQETQKVLTQEGWLKTGDIALQKNNGFFQIVDRKKDMIIVSGFNVYPNEIEDILMSHPDILEAAVVGESCPKSGELVSAFIVKRSNADLCYQEITRYCRELLTPYKVPKKMIFLNELPKSSIGKVLRKELRN
ncbi:AMP-binding protein [Colwellia sp. 75C3]|uniref:AMP-binding protein n=1 Tax=Colwellia sp. 75C3 TaxID=888425 RepID=UPI003FA4D0D0